MKKSRLSFKKLLLEDLRISEEAKDPKKMTVKVVRTKDVANV